jgi:hypothetical protein
MPYALAGNINMTSFQDLLKIFYHESNRPGIRVEEVPFGNVSSFVLEKQKENLLNLVSYYYTGFSFNFTESFQKSSISIYYSSFAYHSPGAMLNEISNLILAHLNKNSLNQSITTYNSPIAPNIKNYSYNYYYSDKQFSPCYNVIPGSIIDILNSLIVALIISLLVLLVGKEKSEGSKKIQLLSGKIDFFLFLKNSKCPINSFWSINKFNFIVLTIKFV